MGPMANSPEVAAFSSFWKGKAHVRKFADSRICMTMGWGETQSDAIPLKIIGFILNQFVFFHLFSVLDIVSSV